MADIVVGLLPSLWPEEAGLTKMAVDTYGVVLAVLADSASFHVTVDVHGSPGEGNLLVVDALVRVAVAVASYQTGDGVDVNNH